MKRNKPDEAGGDKQSAIDRRTVLTGTISTAGYLALGVGSATARGKGRGPPDDSGNPQDECSCSGLSGKYEFNDDECRFEHAEGEDLVTITYDPEDPDQNKDGEECEPIRVDYEADDFYGVTKICAFGGTDNDFDDDPDPEEGTYEPDLTNPGGQRAAISNITFCVEERADALQVDLIHGDEIIDDPCNAEQSYNDQGRLLQARWGWETDGTFEERLEDDQFDRNASEYRDCWVEFDQNQAILQSIQFDVDEQIATVTINPENLAEECDVGDFSLVSYKSINEGGFRFEDCVKQAEFDRDLTGNSAGEFEVDIPVDLVLDNT